MCMGASGGGLFVCRWSLLIEKMKIEISSDGFLFYYFVMVLVFDQ